MKHFIEKGEMSTRINGDSEKMKPLSKNMSE